MTPPFLVDSRGRSRSWTVLIALLAYLVSIKLVVMCVPGSFRSVSQAAVFEWPMLAIWSAAAGVGVVLSRRMGFPGAWDDRTPLRWRLWLPIAIGVAFGVMAVTTDRATHWTDRVAAVMNIPSVHIPWPASLLIYPGGAIVVEIIYRLLPIPLLMWLICNCLLRGRGRSPVFWTLAMLTSLIEPLGDLELARFGFGTMAAVFAQDYALNFAQAYLFRRAGFLAPIIMRTAFYMIWHVA